MDGGLTGSSYIRRAAADSSDSLVPSLQAGVLVIAGALCYLLMPSIIGPLLALTIFVTLAAGSPYLALLSLLATLPLHFVLRRPFGPLDLSLPDVLLLSSVIGLLARVYWQGLLRGSGALMAPLKRVYHSPYFWPGLVLVLISTVLLIFIPPPNRRQLIVGFRQYSLIVEPLVVYALVISTVRGPARLWLLMDVLFAGAVLVSLAGFVEAVDYAVNPRPEVGGYRRVQSLFNHPNTLALYMSRLLPLFGAMSILLPGSNRRKFVYLLGTLLMGGVLLLSGSRGGWLAVAVAAIAIALLGRSFRWLVPAAAAGSVGVGLLALSGQNRLANLLRPGRGSSDTRERLWRAALDEIGESPIWGTGLGNVNWMRRYIPRQRLEGTELVDVHNLFLDFWAKLGLIGLVAVLALLARFYLRTLKTFRRAGGETAALLAALVAAMTGAVVHGLVDAFYFGLPLAVLFWMLLGLSEVLTSETWS